MTKIPRNHVVFFHDKTAMPKRCRRAYKDTLANNPDVNHVFLDDAATIALAEDHFPHLIDTYRNIQIPVTRCDMARVIGIYVYGGMYFDIAMGFQRDARGMIGQGDKLVLLRRDDNPIYSDKASAHLIAGLFVAEKESDFVLSWLKRMYFCIATDVHNDNCAEAGGSGLVTEEYFLRRLQHAPTVRVWNMSEVNGTWFKSRRDPSVNNTWVQTQRDGILPVSCLPRQKPFDLFWNDASRAFE